MVFKYWFALDLDAAVRSDTLPPAHQGLLLFLKATTNPKSAARLVLNLDAGRIPHRNCAACGRSLKDWGGKKHLMNPLGAAPSDVWRDLPRQKLLDPLVPADVLARIAGMSLGEGRKGWHVIQQTPAIRPASTPVAATASSAAAPVPQFTEVPENSVHHGDCVSFLARVAELHPTGRFDLAFADPPYNLAKAYGAYTDERADEQYLAWCNEWLAGMARALKPGGSLLVLNLPKWAMHHAAFLNQHLEFRHWIVWDALSDPRGKIMPAHYALLWFTKPGGAVTCHAAAPSVRVGAGSPLVAAPDSPKYCLRAACIRDRKAASDDERVPLTDVWFDIHRIKHKRDRDAHPCQLPDKLMERIIKLTTSRGGWVFDPFGGAGTTAIAALKLGRKFVVTELDEKYVRITREKLTAMQRHADLFGELEVPRSSAARPRGAASKRAIETYLQALAQRLGRVPTAADVSADQPDMLARIDATYPYRAAAFKRSKIALAGG
jgi:site-specific DNA-methyltransferase (adenine-specific)